jgi:hypothetical protein
VNLRIISEVLGVLVILGGFMMWYHETDNEPLEAAIAEMSLDILKPVLAGLYATQCKKDALGQPMPIFLWTQLQNAQDRHLKLAGREYLPAPCPSPQQ